MSGSLGVRVSADGALGGHLMDLSFHLDFNCVYLYGACCVRYHLKNEVVFTWSFMQMVKTK